MSYAYECPSPDGRLNLIISPIPMRMSHEVDSPMLIDRQTNKTLFDPGSLWAAGGIKWSDDSQMLSMGMLLYPDGHIHFDLALDLAKDRATLTYEDKTVVEGTVAEVEKKMRSAYKAGELAGISE